MKSWMTAAAACAVVALVSAGVAQAAGKKVEDITCEEFLAMNPENQNRIAYWVDGFAEGKNADAAGTVALDKFGQPIGELVTACKASPKETLWQKVKSHL